MYVIFAFDSDPQGLFESRSNPSLDPNPNIKMYINETRNIERITYILHLSAQQQKQYTE